MNLIRFLFLFVLCSLIVQCKTNPDAQNSEQEHDCAYFKTGTFSLIDSEKNLNTTIVRTDGLQTETNNITGAVTKASVTWTDSCTYEMTYLESSSEAAGNIIGKTLVVRMVNIENETYNYTAKLRGSNYTSGNIITKIK